MCDAPVGVCPVLSLCLASPLPPLVDDSSSVQGRDPERTSTAWAFASPSPSMTRPGGIAGPPRMEPEMDDELDFGPSLASRRPPRAPSTTGETGNISRGIPRGDTSQITHQGTGTAAGGGGAPTPLQAATAMASASSSGDLSCGSALIGPLRNAVVVLEPASAPLQLCVLLLQALAPGNPRAVCQV